MKTLRFHPTNLGRFGAALPTEQDGYVRYAPAYVRAYREGRPLPDTDLADTSVLVAKAEDALEEWQARHA